MGSVMLVGFRKIAKYSHRKEQGIIIIIKYLREYIFLFIKDKSRLIYEKSNSGANKSLK